MIDTIVHRHFPKATRSLAHGTKCWCGTCGSDGTWDDMKHCEEPNTAMFTDAVWYNNNHPAGIECHECWLK